MSVVIESSTDVPFHYVLTRVNAKAGLGSINASVCVMCCVVGCCVCVCACECVSVCEYVSVCV